jgi:hypothetical protein
MRKRLAPLLIVFFGCGLLTTTGAQKRPLPAKLFSAKYVYFDNQTGFAAVGRDAVRELKKWDHFHVVERREQADLVLVLSSEEYSDQLDDLAPNRGMNFEPDWFLHFHYRPANAYLTVIDRVSGNTLWAGVHVWGGLLTGFNSAGWRLIHRLRKQIDPRR